MKNNLTGFQIAMIVVIICGVILVLVLSRNRTDQNKAAPITSEPIIVSLDDLVKDYTDNEIAANRKYKDKLVGVVGRIKSVETVFGKAFVVLESTKDVQFTNVQCFFDDNHIDELAKLNKGQVVAIGGTCTGKFLNIALTKCLMLKR